MTGVFNRGFLDEAFPRELSRATRSKNSVSLLLIDIDHFKTINDLYGHLVGDNVLRCFGCLLQERLRGSDIPARYGGEEFAVVLPGSSKDEAVAVAEEFLCFEPERCDLGHVRFPDGIAVTMTIGVATFPQDAQSANDLIRLADCRLYSGKAKGRKRVVAEGGVGRGSVSQPA